jgi:predicted nucleotidyltransferase
VPKRSKHIVAARAREAAAAAARALSADPRVELIYLFGSAVDPEQTVVRDVDLGVLTRPPLDADELLRIRADVVAAVGVPIDLVSLNRVPVVLAHEVVQHGRCLFARTPELETDFVIRARARYWDFKPFLETQWRYAGERLRERRRGA